MPWSSGLRPQSACIVFSAPEITTVSNPKRNPASADVSDQKKMRRFIRVSTEYRVLRTRSAFGQRISLLPPVPNPAIHRNHIRVAHLLQIVGRQRRPEAAATIQH